MFIFTKYEKDLSCFPYPELKTNIALFGRITAKQYIIDINSDLDIKVKLNCQFAVRDFAVCLYRYSTDSVKNTHRTT